MTPDRWFFGMLMGDLRHRAVDVMETVIGPGAARAAGFAPENFHQSFSDRFDDPAVVNALRRAGSCVRAASFTMILDQLQSGGLPAIHWSISPSRGNRNPEFDRLKAAISEQLRAEGLNDACPNRQHVTLSYHAPSAFKTKRIPPIAWRIDTLMLLRGGGRPYRYVVEDQWPLLASVPESPQQADLF